MSSSYPFDLRAAGVMAAPGAVPQAGAAAAPSYSGTNTHEVGVDEPDLVKTDGHRIVTVSRGVLRVINAATRTVTGRLDIADAAGRYRYSSTNLLLDGDHALILVDASYGGPIVIDPGRGDGVAPPNGDPVVPQAPTGPRLMLVDLAGKPRILATYTIDGGLVDARQIGDTARVVVRSAPRIAFPDATPGISTDAARIAHNKAIIAKTGTDAWLPRFDVTDHGATTHGKIACDAVRRPATYTGANLLTVLTFDLAGDALGSGNGVTIAADGDTVYATGTSLYIASDQRPRYGLMGGGLMAGGPMVLRPLPVSPSVKPSGEPASGTEIYRFDISQAGPPVFVGGGHVPGYLVDQYAMSEWAGNLRVATTTGTSWAEADGPPPDAQPSASAVYVLSTTGPQMRQIGVVNGLGKGERIYSVRFIGAVGYVVTFRQTDPLYTVDLSDPTRPRIRGEVKLTGYSAYLHPTDDTHLIGIGQSADAQGHVSGTQVSLFDVADLTSPTRMATFAMPESNSAAEGDPHAFLYWPAARLVVVPLNSSGAAPSDGAPESGMLLLRVADTQITKVGFISQPSDNRMQSDVARSLVIDQTLWTLSDTGAMATDLASLQRQAWMPFG